MRHNRLQWPVARLMKAKGRMRFFGLLFALLSFLFLFAAFGSPVHAQGSFTQEFNFINSDQGFSPYSGRALYVPGAGWRAHYEQSTCTLHNDPNNSGGPCDYLIQIQSNAFPANVTLTSVDFYLSSGLSGNCYYQFSTDPPTFSVNYQDTDCGSSHTMTVNQTSGQIWFGVDTYNVAYSGFITRIVLHGYGINPFPTDTPTPTQTPTPNYYTPIPQTAQPPETCTTPDTRSASFRPGQQQWTLNGGADYAIPLPQQFLRLPPGGSASMSVALSDAEYKLKVIYQSSGLGGGSFVASVGSQPYTIQPADSAEHTFETDPIHYPTGATTLGLSKPATDSVDVTIKFFCLSAVQSSGSGAITTGGNKNDQCETCDPPFSVTDIPGILNWIICNIRRLWTCYLLPILTNILNFIGTIIKFILSFFDWIVRGIGAILNWVAGLISSAWGSITGWVSNLFAGVNNDFHSSGIADDMNIAASRTRDLPTAIGNGISTLGGQLSQIFTNTGQGLGGFVNFIWRLISFGASAIAYVIGLIPLTIQSFVDGINSASTPPSGSPLCSNPTSLAYYPCLGFYVLDNTIFAGPAGYLFPVLVGIIVFYNLVWIFTRIKEELSK